MNASSQVSVVHVLVVCVEKTERATASPILSGITRGDRISLPRAAPSLPRAGGCLAACLVSVPVHEYLLLCVLE